MTNARFLGAQVAVDGRRASAWLPSGLEMSEPPMATLYVAHYPNTIFGSVYNEAGLFLHVRRWGRDARHCPWMLVDDDISLIVGREMLGYPKKMGEIDLDFDSDPMRARVQRRGHDVFSLRATLGKADDEPPSILGHLVFNVVDNVGMSDPCLVAVRAREEVIEAHYVGLEINVTGAPRDPLDELQFGRIERAFYVTTNVIDCMMPVPAGLASRVTCSTMVSSPLSGERG